MVKNTVETNDDRFDIPQKPKRKTSFGYGEENAWNLAENIQEFGSETMRRFSKDFVTAALHQVEGMNDTPERDDDGDSSINSCLFMEQCGINNAESKLRKSSTNNSMPSLQSFSHESFASELFFFESAEQSRASIEIDSEVLGVFTLKRGKNDGSLDIFHRSIDSEVLDVFTLKRRKSVDVFDILQLERRGGKNKNELQPKARVDVDSRNKEMRWAQHSNDSLPSYQRKTKKK
jgi:hypothetical protein